jgi:hypothetical protein
VEDPFSTMLTTLAYSMSQRSRGPAHKEASIDRALGAAASLGLSLAILRLVVFAYKAAKRFENGAETGEGDGDDVDEPVDRFKIVGMESLDFASNAGSAFYNYLRMLLRRLLLHEHHHDSNTSRSRNDTGTVITHQGSCHCRSVQFEVRRRDKKFRFLEL